MNRAGGKRDDDRDVVGSSCGDGSLEDIVEYPGVAKGYTEKTGIPFPFTLNGKNCHHHQIPFNLKGNTSFLSVFRET